MTNKMADVFCVSPHSTETSLKVKKISVCPSDSLLVACLCENDSLHVTSFHQNQSSTQGVFVLVAHRLKSFCWQCTSNHGDCRLAGLTLDGHIQLFEVQSQPLQVTCSTQIHAHTIAGLLSTVAEQNLIGGSGSTCGWQLQQYGGDWLCLHHANHAAVFTASTESIANTLLCQIDAGLKLCMQRHLLCALQVPGRAVLYSLPDGSVVASLSLPLSIDMTQVWTAALASDDRTLVLVMRTGGIHWMTWSDSALSRSYSLPDQSGSSSLHSSYTDVSIESPPPTSGPSRPNSPSPVRYTPLNTVKRSKLHTYRKVSKGVVSWAVSGFQQNAGKRHSDSAVSTGTANVLVPEELLGLDIQDAALHGNQLQLSLRDTASDVSWLVLLSPNATPQTHRVEAGHHLVIQHDSCRPPLVLTSSGWYLLSPFTQPAGLVNQLMLYGSAGVADTLCHHNAWDRCSIPMHALQVGLQHRQLDTISFFLKSRENVLCEAATPGGAYVEGEVEQVHSAVRLLLATLDAHRGDPQAHQFSDQLMHITASFLHRSLLRVLSAGQSPGHQVAARTLTGYLDQVWRRKPTLAQDAAWYQQSSREWPQGQLTTQQRDSAQQWEQMNYQEAVTQALLQGDLALLQACQATAGWDGEAPHSFSDLRTQALEGSLRALQNRSMDTACKLLANMGLCVAEQLRRIWLHTADRQLRDYLSSEMEERGWLSSTDLDLVAYVGQLESVYPCTNFQLACSMHQPIAHRWTHIADLRSQLGPSGSALPLAWCGEINQAEPVNTPTAAYCCVLLDWLTRWSHDTRAAVLWPHLIHQKDPHLMKLVDANSLWDFLTSHGDWPRLQQWMESPPEGDVSWPYSLPWDSQMLERLEGCPHLVQQQVKDAAAKRGVVLGTGREWVRSLARVQGVLSAEQWQTVLQYLVENELAELTYFYLEHIRWTGAEDQLCPGQGDLPPWLSFLLASREVDSGTMSSVLKASVANHQFLGGKTVPGVDGPLLEGASIARTLGTLVYAPETLKQLLSSGQSELLTMLRDHPRLHQALCPNEARLANTPRLTVYTLLQGHAPFDMTHMFSWQPTNPLSPQAERGEMPHFTQSSLVNTWAAEVELSWSYYVEQGRPCFAWLAFLQEQLRTGATTLTSKQMKSVCLHAKQLALTHFLDSRITIASVVFMELLGQDSTALRVSLQAAMLLHQHAMATRGQQEALQAQRQIGALMWACARGRKRVVPVAVSLLEQATRWSAQRPQGHSVDEWMPWQLVLQFCQLHQVPMSAAYLRDVASRDDWLRFLVFAQLHQFPKAQLLELLPTFPSAHLREHLHYVIQHVPALSQAQRSTPTQAPIKSRDVRAQLYARIGLKQTREISDSSSSSDEETETAGTSQDASNISHATIPSSPDLGRDIFSLLLACRSTPSPWRCLLACAVEMENCVLAVLAACFQGACLTSCACVWVVAAAPEVATPAIHEAFSDPQHHNWTPADLCELAQMLIQADALATLTDALEIFDPDSSVLPFLQFSLQLTTQYPLSEKCEALLGQFKESLQQLREGPKSATSLLTAPLVESIVCAVLWRLLSCLRLRSSMGLLLRLLDETHAAAFHHCQVPDVGLLWRLHQATRDTGVTLDYVALALPQDPSGQHQAEARLLVTNLTDAGHYNAARLVSEIVATDSYHITLSQLDQELQGHQSSAVWQQAAARAQFWLHCRDLLNRHHVPPKYCVEFFQNHLTSAEPGLERGLLLKLAYDHQVAVRPTEPERENQLLLQLWQSRLTLHTTRQVDTGSCWSTSSIRELVMSDGEHLAPRQALLDASIGFDPQETPKVALSAKEKRSLDCLLGSLLTRGHLKVASRIAAMFGHYCQDLDIVGTCSVLAQGRLPPNQLSLHLKQRLASSTGPRRRLSTPTNLTMPNRARTMSVTSLATLAEDEGSPDVILATLEQLQSLCQHATPAAQRITVNYRVAKALGRPFEEVLVQDEFSLLHELLHMQPSPNFKLVKTFIQSCALTEEQVAEFLCCTMVDRLQKACTTSIQGAAFPVPAEVTGNVELAQLCQKPSVLAQRLLAAVAGQNQQQTESLWLQVALLVQSHDCFTLACSMEGISSVLRAARTLAAQLRTQGHYRLLISLLTGVGRFNEMKYIFDILKQDDQFELLLKKGNDKEESLRVAILDYLQQSQPVDRDLYTMVALHFTMFRQIAAMLEKRAVANMKRLRDRTLENNPEVQGALQNILHDFSDAAESYVKEKCVRHAERCVRQARLIALQCQLLTQGSKTTVINLHKAEAIQFIQTHSHFYQAYMVEDMYRVGGAWPGALLNLYVLQFDQKYLSDFQGYIKITSFLISEVADRYKLLPQKAKGSSTNMRQLLSFCPDLRTRMKLATDLGFTDLQQQMLRGPEAAYLKDCLHV